MSLVEDLMREMQELQSSNKELQWKMNEFMADVSGFLIDNKLTLIAVSVILLIASYFCDNTVSPCPISVLVFIYFNSAIKSIFTTFHVLHNSFKNNCLYIFAETVCE